MLDHGDLAEVAPTGRKDQRVDVGRVEIEEGTGDPHSANGEGDRGHAQE